LHRNVLYIRRMFQMILILSKRLISGWI
jgi:hypothetical protein